MIPGGTSTGSKRPESLFGRADGGPRRMVRAQGCRVWDDDGRAYVDLVMALGAVALGYGHPAVVAAVERAARDGMVGSLPPVLEGEVAERLAAVVPGVEAVRFLKTGAEGVAAAVRIARTVTGRDRVVTCGYHGWLDWCQDAPGVPGPVRELRRSVPFNDPEALRRTLATSGPVAAVVIEPVVDAPPDPAWLALARELTSAQGAVLVFDEIKTAFRVARGGVAERLAVTPDLIVLGKALGNGMPIAAVGGAASLMEAATRTWISSTLATEYVSLAAARAVLEIFDREPVVQRLETLGERWWRGLGDVAARHPRVVAQRRGVPQMSYLRFHDEDRGGRVAREMAKHGVLFKRSAYNFVSLAHEADTIDTVIERLDAVVEEATPC